MDNTKVLLESEVKRILEENGTGEYFVQLKEGCIFDVAMGEIVDSSSYRRSSSYSRNLAGSYKGSHDETTFRLEMSGHIIIPYSAVSTLEKFNPLPQKKDRWIEE